MINSLHLVDHHVNEMTNAIDNGLWNESTLHVHELQLFSFSLTT